MKKEEQKTTSPKVYVVGGGSHNAKWINNCLIVNSIPEADIVIFTGGEDINPKIYNREIHPYTSFNERRDSIEISAFKTARALRKIMIGICRGHQLLCALSGGSLIQHQTGNGSHDIQTNNGLILPMTHAHHQAAYLGDLKENEDYVLLAWDVNKRICEGESREDIIEVDKHPEIVWFKKTKSLGIQGHPEWMNSQVHNKTLDYLNELIKNFLEKNICEII